ncbi:MAG: histone deacetylase [Anaerolineales bacterium]
MEDLVYFYPDGHAAHAVQGHPERPERVETIRQGLEAAGLWRAPLPALTVPDEVLYAVHTAAYLKNLQSACAAGMWYDADTYLLPASWELALRTAGGACRVADAVWRREADKGFALCRPPGHHAGRQCAMGFCLLNNIALATEFLCQQHHASRLAIVDLDVHHGNGTQQIFWERGDVLYISLHQWPFYPGSGRAWERGGGDGLGATLNCPLPAGTGDEGALACLEKLILPALQRFAPQMVLVSAGFDAHWRDPLADFRFSAQGYYRLMQLLTGFCNQECKGRLAVMLEGGV